MPHHGQFARGGAKPQMLAGSVEVPITVGNQRKFGIYELDERKKILARRVELPEWLSRQVEAIPPAEDLIPFFAQRRWQLPRTAIAESKGHIFLDPSPKSLGTCPLVGLDTEVFDRFQGGAAITEVRFIVYGTDYVEFEKWQIQWSRFIELAQLVETNPSFMPQWMVPLSALARCRC